MNSGKDQKMVVTFREWLEEEVETMTFLEWL